MSVTPRAVVRNPRPMAAPEGEIDRLIVPVPIDMGYTTTITPPTGTTWIVPEGMSLPSTREIIFPMREIKGIKEVIEMILTEGQYNNHLEILRLFFEKLQ